MARNLGTTQLGSQRAAFESQAANSQAQALAALRERIAQQNLEQEAIAGQQKQSIIDALIAAGINPRA
jgi:predicted transcriptional regulator YheO